MLFRKKNLILQLYDVINFETLHQFKNFIFSSKLIEKSSKDASIVKAYSAELFSGSTKETRINGAKLNFRIKLLFLLFILLYSFRLIFILIKKTGST
jgi:hypothetical protein